MAGDPRFDPNKIPGEGLVKGMVDKYPWHDIERPRTFAGAVYLMTLVIFLIAHIVKAFAKNPLDFPTSIHWMMAVIPVMFAAVGWLTLEGIIHYQRSMRG